MTLLHHWFMKMKWTASNTSLHMHCSSSFLILSYNKVLNTNAQLIQICIVIQWFVQKILHPFKCDELSFSNFHFLSLFKCWTWTIHFNKITTYKLTNNLNLFTIVCTEQNEKDVSSFAHPFFPALYSIWAHNDRIILFTYSKFNSFSALS